LKTHSFFITCAPFHEGLLLEEVKNLGITDAKETHLGVSFNGTLKDAYQILIWSHLAHHVLLKLKEFRATNQHALYHEIKKITWSQHLTSAHSLRIDVLGKHQQFTHPHYLAQVAKDAIVDQLREHYGDRPNIQKEQPDIVLTIKAKHEDCQLYLDLSGESLHLRGYRHQAGPAPLKETLAAALVLRAGWRKRLQTSNPILLDPMCGSGTILIEAALMAFDIAPGLTRNYFGCLKWQQHDAKLWQELISQAQQRKAQGLKREDVYLIGFDQHPQALIFATNAAKKSGIEQRLILEKRNLKQLELPTSLPQNPGLIITNPPYGIRLLNNQNDEVQEIFKTLGEHLRTPRFNDWEAYIITHNREPAKALGIRLGKAYRFKNGDLECELLQFQITPSRFFYYDFNQKD
jgi:23S rRNA (guanine2445-N2)-methyltransferase / 23S rRNA (guanine2069-N7)-methyltransferase